MHGRASADTAPILIVKAIAFGVGNLTFDIPEPIVPFISLAPDIPCVDEFSAGGSREWHGGARWQGGGRRCGRRRRRTAVALSSSTLQHHRSGPITLITIDAMDLGTRHSTSCELLIAHWRRLAIIHTTRTHILLTIIELALLSCTSPSLSDGVALGAVLATSRPRPNTVHSRHRGWLCGWLCGCRCGLCCGRRRW